MTMLSDFLKTYVIPYIPTIITLGVLLGIGSWLAGRGKFSRAKAAMAAEIRMNIETSKSILAYVEDQKVGDPYTTPIPRLYTSAFNNLKDQGFIFKLKRALSEDLMQIYQAIATVNQASDRQEELAVGAGATSPLAPDLRSQNLAFIHNTISNVIKPRLERLITTNR
jgi:hypothetical protein